jgi:hypothetical protein
MMGRVAKITPPSLPPPLLLLLLPLLLLLALVLLLVVALVFVTVVLYCTAGGAYRSTHIAGMIPNAMRPEPHVAGRESDADLCLEADIQLSRSSGEAELSAINVTAATSSGMPYWSIRTSRAIDRDM